MNIETRLAKYLERDFTIERAQILVLQARLAAAEPEKALLDWIYAKARGFAGCT